MTRITSSSRPLRSTPECATAELVDDILVCYRANALAGRAGVIDAESFSDAQRLARGPERPQVRLTRPEERPTAEEETSMNNGQRGLPIDALCRSILTIIGLVIFGLASASPAAAQVDTMTANFVDWDLPALEGAGPCPSAIGAVTIPPSGDPVYYVTRCDSTSPNNPNRVGPVLLRFTPGTPMDTAVATWRAWNLGTIPGSPVGAVDLGPTGGMKITRAGNVAFVRGATQIIRVNMSTNVL